MAARGNAHEKTCQPISYDGKLKLVAEAGGAIAVLLGPVFVSSLNDGLEVFLGHRQRTLPPDLRR